MYTCRKVKCDKNPSDAAAPKMNSAIPLPVASAISSASNASNPKNTAGAYPRGFGAVKHEWNS